MSRPGLRYLRQETGRTTTHSSRIYLISDLGIRRSSKWSRVGVRKMDWWSLNSSRNTTSTLVDSSSLMMRIWRTWLRCRHRIYTRKAQLILTINSLITLTLTSTLLKLNFPIDSSPPSKSRPSLMGIKRTLLIESDLLVTRTRQGSNLPCKVLKSSV
jgi:hypothetical protein